MWTPPQWRPGFAFVFAATLGLSGALIFAHGRGSAWGMGVSAGVIIGLFLALAWTVRRQVWPVTAALGTAVIPFTTMLWLASPQSLPWTAAAAAAVIAAWFGAYGQVGLAANREAPHEAEPLGGDGRAGHALIVFHPSRGGFQTALQRAFAEGLKAQGWRVDLATASARTPAPPAEDVDLLVLGAPVYNFRAARPVRDYVKRLGDLGGRPVALVLSGGGMTDVAMREVKAQVRRAGGEVAGAWELWTQRPNSERYDSDDALAIIRRAGETLAVPPRKGAA